MRGIDHMVRTGLVDSWQPGARRIRTVARVFKHHVDSCVPEGVALGPDETRKRLNELVDIFDRFSK